MAKDYFQDIVPPSGNNNYIPQRKVRVAPVSPQPVTPEEEDVENTGEDQYVDDDISVEDTAPAAPRGIRNINIAPRARPIRTSTSNGMGGSDMREVPGIGRGLPSRPRRKSSRIWVWMVVIVCLLALGFLALFLFRQTTITLVPRTQTITFDQSSHFVAYPQESAATSTLQYSTATTDLTYLETVDGNGVTSTQMKSSGSITVYNNYSASSIKLIANTRFQASSGLVFRIPAAIVIPGKTASKPGSVQVTVIADQSGPQYNIGPSRFAVPGLQSIPTEYTGVYAQSSGSMTGGFSGNQEGVAPDVRQNAISNIRTHLSASVAQYITSQSTASSTAFGPLAEVTYTDLPDMAASSSSQVQINESAHVVVPVFSSTALAMAVAQTMGINTDNSTVMLVTGSNFAAQSNDATAVNIGIDPVDFTLVGNAKIMWSIDATALTKALAGRSQSSFETIIGSFPAIESAHARIEPFWTSNFPGDPTKIKVIIQDESATLTSVSPTTTHDAL
jgi:hypothetical protein